MSVKFDSFCFPILLKPQKIWDFFPNCLTPIFCGISWFFGVRSWFYRYYVGNTAFHGSPLPTADMQTFPTPVVGSKRLSLLVPSFQSGYLLICLVDFAYFSKIGIIYHHRVTSSFNIGQPSFSTCNHSQDFRAGLPVNESMNDKKVPALGTVGIPFNYTFMDM